MSAVLSNGSAQKLLTFAERFAHRFGSSPIDFPEACLLTCLYRHARVLFWLAGPLRHEIFLLDFNSLGVIGQATNLSQVESELIYTLTTEPRSWTRHLLKLRLSRRRVRALARELFQP